MAARVLLIEDHPDVADLFELKLRLEGYRVAVARDGISGLELAGSLQPDVVLLDLHLPGMNGLQMLARLRDEESTKNIPVVIFTEDDSPDLRAKATRLNISAYLLKAHVLPSRLAEVVSQVVRERQPAEPPGAGGGSAGKPEDGQKAS